MKILWLTAVALTALVLAGILGIQTPQVQTYLSRKILEKFEGSTDAAVSFEKLHVKPFNTLVLKNVAVTDNSPAGDTAADTLFSAEYVIARFTLRGLRKQEGLHIWRAVIKDARMNLVLEEGGTNLERMFGIKGDRNKSRKDRNIFDIRRVDINGMGFRLQNLRKGPGSPMEHKIDWSDLDIRNINIAARNLRMSRGIMSGRLDWLSFEEKSGYACTSLSGKAKVGGGKAIIENLEIHDLWSDVNMPSFVMSYSSSKDFSDFVNKVRLDADINSSILDMATLSYFTRGISDNPLKITLKGKVSGYVNSLEFTGLEADAGSRYMKGKFSGRISGLPDVSGMTMDMKVDGLSFGLAGLENFIGYWNRGKGPDIGKYASGTVFDINGNLRGTLGRLDAKMHVASESGEIMADITARNLASKDRPASIEGTIGSSDLDLGSIFGTGIVRQCSMAAGLYANLGGKGEDPSVRIDSLMISRLNINGYDYSDIAAKGAIAKEAFDGKIICNDPALSFMFQGLFNLSRKTSNALYKFYLNVGYADLNAMNIDRRGISRARFRTTANFNWIKRTGDLLGDIDIGDLVLENRMGKHDIGDIAITSYSGDNVSRMKFTSAFADGNFAGTGSVREFVRDLMSVTLKKELPAMFRDSTSTWDGGRYRLSFKTYDTMDLLAFLVPGLYIADSTSVSMTIDTSGYFKARLNSSRLAFKEQYVKDMTCTLDNSNGSIGGAIHSESIRLATLMLKNNRIELFADNNHIGAGFSYDNESRLTNRGEFFATGDVLRDTDGVMRLNVNVLPSSIYLNSREWSILPSSFSIKGKEIEVDNMGFTSGDQAIKIYGNTSEYTDSRLILEMDRFDISIINPLLRQDIRFSGAVTGRAELLTPFKAHGLDFNFLCDSAEMAGARLGTVTMTGTLDNRSKSVDFVSRNSIDGHMSFSVEGKYGLESGNIRAGVVLDMFDIACASPFVKNILSDMRGGVSGEISVDGPMDRIAIKSEGARLDNAELRIAYTNVPYLLNGDFQMDETGIRFGDMRLTDMENGRGRVTGGLSFDHFRDIRFDTTINVFDMQCIDIDETDAETFYGDIKASGTVGLTGPMKSILLSVNAVTAGNGQIHIPVSSSGNAGSGDLLTFKEPVIISTVDPYEALVARFKEDGKSSGDFRMRLRIAATQDTEAFIEIDKASGNVLSGRGDGVIELELQPSKDIFNITGDYTIASGNYRFVALGLASRDFSIQEGSTVRFNGDIMESTLDIDAVYNTKASLSTLIADTTSVANRRNVECGISITDKLSNPRLSFSINIPDLDPTVKSRVESALSTEDKIQKQFLSLIISNSFLPDEQSGVVNNASVLYSNVAEIMSNQLNNIFQKLNIPLDLGLSYQPNEKGNDIFDVAVSTQLFNNRVIVNGNIGNRQYASSTSSSDVVGDLDIEIKLTRSGALRLTLFSHSADEYTNYLDNSQRNGIGIAYQTEFDRIDTFFKNLFTGRKKREEAARLAFEERRSQKKKVITITAP